MTVEEFVSEAGKILDCNHETYRDALQAFPNVVHQRHKENSQANDESVSDRRTPGQDGIAVVAINAFMNYVESTHMCTEDAEHWHKQIFRFE